MLIVCSACQVHSLLDSAHSDQECRQCGASFTRRSVEAALIGVFALTTAACYGGPPPHLQQATPASDPSEQPSEQPSATPEMPAAPR